jgi:hypothetical protein
MLRKPELEFVFEVRAELGAALEVGQNPRGFRRIIPITGGTFEGPNVKGRVLPGGADWQSIRSDSLAEIDARYTLETNSGELIYVRNSGIRHCPPDVMKRLTAGETVDPSLYYFRTVPRFETAAPAWMWLMRSIFVCSGERHAREVCLRFWCVL